MILGGGEFLGIANQEIDGVAAVDQQDTAPRVALV
jgi:hypothetical protein